MIEKSDKTFKTLGFLTSMISVWTIVVGASLLWNLHTQKMEVKESARIAAKTSIEKDIIYRYWSAMHGGVYVPITDYTQPNPYLDFIERRDIETTTGDKLTLINPAYMTRQVHEIGESKFNVFAHITSLNPIRPENEADEWETIALEKFENGEVEYSSIEQIDNIPYLKYMIPLDTQDQCLKCHASQGYKIGDVRGGISVAIPLLPLRQVSRSNITAIIVGHTIVWVFGVLGIIFATNILKQRTLEREKAEISAEKTKTAYMFATTIGHEFNNPLAVIKGITDTWRLTGDRDQESLDAAFKVLKQTVRMSNLVSKLLSLQELEEIDYAAGVKILNLNNESVENSGKEKDSEA
jgi:Protein of unknown function (DUF3365)/His Kinase A (phospho-acceptor) domain